MKVMVSREVVTFLLKNLVMVMLLIDPVTRCQKMRAPGYLFHVEMENMEGIAGKIEVLFVREIAKAMHGIRATGMPPPLADCMK